MSRQTIAQISQQAVRHNLAVVRALAPDSQVVSVVKADAYGHGTQHVARALDETDLFAVATISEARSLRETGWSGRLLLLEGVTSVEEFHMAKAVNAELVIHEALQIKLLREQKAGSGQICWLKIDTGMHRLGFPHHETGQVYSEIVRLCKPSDVVLMTHFACADEPGNPMTGRQITRFDNAVGELPGPHSLANSAGVLNFPSSRREYIRPGIMLYGISPCAGLTALDIGLQPVMSLSCELIAINECPRGASVGYGASFRCPEDMRIGVGAIGYGDGYPRHIRNGAPVLVNGLRARIAGRVSMDMITIDLRGHDNARVGDVVTLWDQHLPVEEVAAWADAVPYELVCAVTRRVRRVEV